MLSNFPITWSEVLNTARSLGEGIGAAGCLPLTVVAQQAFTVQNEHMKLSNIYLEQMM